MKLKKIKTFGFKTFAEPTTLEFGDGITAVVGPNGSGKSNLVDAFRWVLGETSSRSLRSGKLEDVIFAGNEKRKPLGLAEVSVTFDNSDGRLPIDFSEVEITRRAYRAGESEYFINRNQVRLRDIIDLLMGTGLGPGSYSIVSQGQIDAFLTSKPTERRALFEETSGIAKFLARKNESMRRLDQTEQNAIRINDLVSELEKRIPELETQVRRAKRYRKVSSRVRDLEIVSYIRASASRRHERETLRAEAEHNEERRGLAGAKSATLGAQLAELRTTTYKHELGLEELRSHAQRVRAELATLEAEYAAALARREALEAQSTQTGQDAARVAAERENLEQSIASLEERLAPMGRLVETAREEELAAQSALATSRSQLDAVFTQLRAVESAAAQDAARKAERRMQRENLRTEAERHEQQAREARERSAQLEIAAGSAAQAYAQREVDFATLEVRATHARSAVTTTERQAVASQEALARSMNAAREASGEVKAAESRAHTIEELENALEGHVPGTRAVIEAKNRDELSGIEGIVSNLITTDERYARAMDIAFGARLSNIVVTSSEDAERAIEFLQRREAGRATFLPLDTLANRDGRVASDEIARVPGVIAYAHELIRTDERYAGVVRFLVGNVLVVDTLATGIHLVRERGFRDSVVTLSGEQISGGGAITGGRFAREKSLLSRRVQLQTLREQLTELQDSLAQRETALEAARVFADHAKSARDDAREALGKFEIQLAELRADMVKLSENAERAQHDFIVASALLEDLSHKAHVARQVEHELEGDEPHVVASDEERVRLEVELAAIRERIARAEFEQLAATEHAAEVRERFAALTAERDAASGRFKMLDHDEERATLAREQMLAEIGELLHRTQTLHQRIDGLRVGVAEADSRLEVARRERERFVDETTRTESDVRLAENEEREAHAAGERTRMRLAEIDGELGMLVSQFAQNPAGEDELRDVESRYSDESDSVLDELPRLREEVARLSSNVNLNAEAERDELAERDNFLRAQLEDLSKARETLLESIKAIEGQTQTQFNETFERVALEFSKSYAQLFPGGVAEMWQTNPENLAETGIEIAVQPPGKKRMPPMTLSGGERAMACASLIFALVRTKPSPFYLLDEIDAALDDSNVEILANTLRELSAQSQMLVVTHNKKTMELAERMYGVTMAEPGVSSVISAELTKADESRELSLV